MKSRHRILHNIFGRLRFVLNSAGRHGREVQEQKRCNKVLNQSLIWTVNQAQFDSDEFLQYCLSYCLYKLTPVLSYTVPYAVWYTRHCFKMHYHNASPYYKVFVLKTIRLKDLGIGVRTLVGAQFPDRPPDPLNTPYPMGSKDTFLQNKATILWRW